MQQATVICESLPAMSWQHWSASSFSDDLAVFRFCLYPEIELPTQLRALLQPAEVDRAQRYRREEDRHRFMHSRVILRILCGRYTKQTPDSIRFLIGTNKKPEIKDVPDLHFNVSHAGQWVLVAMSRASVGVDIENAGTDFPFQDIVSHSFSAEEQTYLENSANIRAAFYRLWTRKEALLKATAKGIDDDFQRIPALDGTHQTVDDLIGQGGSWTVRSFGVADDYQAAIVSPTATKLPKFYTIDADFLRL